MGFELGNQEAKKGDHKNKRRFAAELNLAISAVDLSDPNGATKLRKIADALIEKAITDKDVSAIREIADRIDGKVPQAVVGDDEHDPLRLVHRIERVIVKAANPDSGDIPAASDAGPV